MKEEPAKEKNQRQTNKIQSEGCPPVASIQLTDKEIVAFQCLDWLHV
jgi:hypothetical protein